MNDDEVFDFYVRDPGRKVITGKIDFEAYVRLYHLLYDRPDLEAIIAEKLSASSRVYGSEAAEFVGDVTQLVASEYNIEIPAIPEGSMQQERWAIAWNKVRKHDLSLQQGIEV